MVQHSGGGQANQTDQTGQAEDDDQSLSEANYLSALRKTMFEAARQRYATSCIKCHSMTPSTKGRVEFSWRSGPRSFNYAKFSHSTHLPKIKHLRVYARSGSEILDQVNQPRAGGQSVELGQSCQTCHAWEENVEQATKVSRFTGLLPQAKMDCAKCHNRKRGLDSCITCHNYHVTRP